MPAAIPGTVVASGAGVGPGGDIGSPGATGQTGTAGDAQEVGSIKAWPSVTPPASWALMDGSAVSRTLYPALFTLIGTTFGTGDGSTTFNLPDARSRFLLPAGQGASLTNRILAATGGEENHQLTVAELAQHSHGINASSVSGASGSAVSVVAGTNTQTGVTGSNTPHNNMPPFLVLTYIIKVSPTGGPTAQAPIADTTQPGLLNKVSGNVLDYIGGDNASHPLIAPTIEYYDQEDFMTLVPGGTNIYASKLFLCQYSGGTGAVVALYVANIYDGHPGVLQLAPGTTASSWARAHMQGAVLINANLTLTIEGIMTPSNGSFAGNNQYFFGLASSAGPVIAATQSYAGFYANAAVGPNWYMYTRNLAVLADNIDTGIPVTTAVNFHKFKIVATLGSISFYIDDVLIGTTTDNSVPTATAVLYVCFFTNNGSGALNYSLFVDCFDIWTQPVAQSGQSPTRFMRSIR
jgi:microcystin-dependent protein